MKNKDVCNKFPSYVYLVFLNILVGDLLTCSSFKYIHVSIMISHNENYKSVTTFHTLHFLLIFNFIFKLHIKILWNAYGFWNVLSTYHRNVSTLQWSNPYETWLKVNMHISSQYFKAWSLRQIKNKINPGLALC